MFLCFVLMMVDLMAVRWHHAVVWLAFPWGLVTLCTSRVLMVTSISLFEKYLILCPFLNILLLLSCRSSLHVLDTHSLTDTWFANIFFSWVACHSVDFLLWYAAIFEFHVSCAVYFSLGCFCFWCHIQKITLLTNDKFSVIKLFSYVFFLEFYS